MEIQMEIIESSTAQIHKVWHYILTGNRHIQFGAQKLMSLLNNGEMAWYSSLQNEQSIVRRGTVTIVYCRFFFFFNFFIYSYLENFYKDWMLDVFHSYSMKASRSNAIIIKKSCSKQLLIDRGNTTCSYKVHFLRADRKTIYGPPWLSSGFGMCAERVVHISTLPKLLLTIIHALPLSGKFWDQNWRKQFLQRDMRLELPVTSWRIPKSDALPVYTVMWLSCLVTSMAVFRCDWSASQHILIQISILY